MNQKKASPSVSDFPTLYFDGGSRGNPGRAAGAAVIVMPNQESYTVSEYLPFATNNEAEYTGLIIGLKKALELGIKELEIQGDSNLVVNQVNGAWKVKSDRLRGFCTQARSLLDSFTSVTLTWIPRGKNQLADAAANQCMDNPASETPAAKNSDLSLSEIVADYELGDVVTITHPDNPKLSLPSIVKETPKQLENGKWLLTVEIVPERGN